MNVPPARAENAAPELPGGLWLTLADLARRKNVTRQTIGQHVANLVAENRIQTRPGKGGTKLVNVAQYDLARNEVGDVTKEVSAEHSDLENDSSDPLFRDSAAREKRYRADLAELEVLRRLSELVPVADLAEAVANCAEAVVRVIDRLPLNADEMAAAVGKDGAGGARAQYKRDAREMRTKIVTALQGLLETIHGQDAATTAIVADEAHGRFGLTKFVNRSG